MADVFVSYSRRDREAVEAVVTALRAAGQDVWVDLEGILPSANWMDEIKQAIAGADSVLFFISPDSAESEVCRTELNESVALAKRIVPVVIRDTPAEAVPPPLPDINWLFVRAESFDADVERIIQTLQTDIDRVHAHTRLLVRATEWEHRGADKGLLLRGAQLTEAERWLTTQSDQKPTTTPAQARYISASRKAATGRLRGLLAGSATAVAVLAVVAAVAIFQWHSATVQRNEARARFRESTALRLSAEAQSMVAGNRDGGDVRAFQQLVAANALEPMNTQIDAGLVDTLVRRGDLRKIIGAPGEVDAVAIDPSGHRLASAGENETVELWDADTGREIGAPMQGQNGAVKGLAFSPDGHLLASASVDHTVQLWNVDANSASGPPLTGFSGPVFGVAFSPDGRRLAAGGAGGALIWDVATRTWVGSELSTEFGADVLAVAFSPDGRRLAAATGDYTVVIWNVDTHQPVGQPLRGHTDVVNTLAFSPDGHRLVTGGVDASVRLWNADTGAAIGAPMVGHVGGVNSVAFSPDGHALASAGFDKTVRLWNADTGQPLGPPLVSHQDIVWSVVFSPDGAQLVSGSRDGTVRIWNVDSSVGRLLVKRQGPVTGLAVSPDGRTVAAAAADGGLWLWDIGARRTRAVIVKGGGTVTSVAFSPDGRTLVTGDDANGIQLWDAGDGRVVGPTLTGHRAAVSSVVFSPDGHRVVSGDLDGTVLVTDVGTGKSAGAPLTGGPAPSAFPGNENTVTSLVFNPDGQRIAAANADGMVRIWDAHTGKLIGVVHTGVSGLSDDISVRDAAFSPDGRQLVTADGDGTVGLWDPTADKQDGSALTGHTGRVNGVLVSPDGRRLVSVGADGTVRVWDAGTRTQIGPAMPGHIGAVTHVVSSSDGAELVTAGADGTVRLWPGPALWPTVVCDKLTSDMSDEQWGNWVSPDIERVPMCAKPG